MQVLVARLQEYLDQNGGEGLTSAEVSMDLEEAEQEEPELAPIVAAPAPVATTPAPVAAATTPVAATPTPVAVTPTPVAVTPTPVAATPTPVAATPTPVAASPVAKPSPVKVAPVAESVSEPVAKAAEAEPATNNEAKESSEAKPEENNAGKGIKRKRQEEPFVVQEDEPEIDEALVCLDWYNSDLSVRIDKTNLMVGEPLYKDGWGYVWSGVRATCGFTSGKVFFEAKALANLEVQLGSDEKNPNELRVGWSTSDTEFQLGEAVGSFSYGGSGKKGEHRDQTRTS